MPTVRLLRDVSAALPWDRRRPAYLAGAVLPVIPATNQPQDRPDAIRYWVDTPELEGDCYGLGLIDGDFTLLADGEGR